MPEVTLDNDVEQADPGALRCPAARLELPPPAAGLPPLVGLLAADGALLRLGFGADPAQRARAFGALPGAEALPLASEGAHAAVAASLIRASSAPLCAVPPPEAAVDWALGGLRLRAGGTAFQRAVWAQLAVLPPGQVSTYGALCVALGRGAGSARAVGAAVGQNPLAPLLPCHRVRGADGGLHGFAYGLEAKAALLRWEGGPAAGIGDQLGLWPARR